MNESIDGYAAPLADYHAMQRKLNALLQPPPGFARYVEMQEQLAAAYREPLANAARTAAAISASFQPVAVQVAETLMVTQEALRSSVKPLIERDDRFRSAWGGGGQLALARDHLRAIRETQSSYTSGIAGVVNQATAALTLAQQSRVRNAVAHWAPGTGPPSSTEYYLALVSRQIAEWAADGSRRLRVFAAVAADALKRGALGLFASLARRATTLTLVGADTFKPTASRVERVAERLRLIRASLNPHAPPFCPA